MYAVGPGDGSVGSLTVFPSLGARAIRVRLRSQGRRGSRWSAACRATRAARSAGRRSTQTTSTSTARGSTTARSRPTRSHGMVTSSCHPATATTVEGQKGLRDAAVSRDGRYLDAQASPPMDHGRSMRGVHDRSPDRPRSQDQPLCCSGVQGRGAISPGRSDTAMYRRLAPIPGCAAALCFPISVWLPDGWVCLSCWAGARRKAMSRSRGFCGAVCVGVIGG